jgi:hypothetical protein
MPLGLRFDASAWRTPYFMEKKSEADRERKPKSYNRATPFQTVNHPVGGGMGADLGSLIRKSAALSEGLCDRPSGDGSVFDFRRYHQGVQ